MVTTQKIDTIIRNLNDDEKVMMSKLLNNILANKPVTTTNEQPKMSVNQCSFCYPGVCPTFAKEKQPEQCPGH